MDKAIIIYYPEDGYDYPSESYTQRDCYEYNAPTQVGDCGSLVGLYNHRMERKIIGMHVAGSNEQYGFACPLTQEALNGACDRMAARDLKNISAQFYYEMPQNLTHLWRLAFLRVCFVHWVEQMLRLVRRPNLLLYLHVYKEN